MFYSLSDSLSLSYKLLKTYRRPVPFQTETRLMKKKQEQKIKRFCIFIMFCALILGFYLKLDGFLHPRASCSENQFLILKVENLFESLI